MKEKKKIKFKAHRKKISFFYVGGVFLLTFVLAALISFSTDLLLESATVTVSLIILLTVIMVGIAFDIIGVAATSAADTLFHAMASDKVPGAKESIFLVKNAEKVSNFCNDVVGDICGIVSGSISSFVLVAINSGGVDGKSLYASFLMTAGVSSLTVGGKALGKYFAIAYNNQIVFLAGRILHFFHFGILRKKNVLRSKR